jgi:hypothetical protein
LEYRITKYDPALRESSGAFIGDEWTSMGDIGRSFGGVVLTHAEYLRVENAYITALVAFLSEAGVQALTVAGLENCGGAPRAFDDGSLVPLEEAAEVIRRVLREEFWCRLEAPEAFVHLGYDYNMYVGVPQTCPEAEQLAKQLGLFVEPFRSPYHKHGPD